MNVDRQSFLPIRSFAACGLPLLEFANGRERRTYALTPVALAAAGLDRPRPS